jgi:hypothetical protein
MTQKRFLLFMVCILIRGLMVYVSNINIKYRRIIAWILVIAVLGMLKIIITGDKREKGIAGQEIWWGYLRPIHVILWTIFIVMTFIPTYTKYAWMVLLLDLTIGIIAWIIQQQKLGNFLKIIE